LGADSLKIGTHIYSSRLIVGTGKYPSEDIAKKAIDLSGSELVTLALKRFSEEESSENILRPIGNRRLLPNTAGVLTADDAIRSAHISKELFKTNLLKLEIISSPENLDPNMEETLKAAKYLSNEDFETYVYCDRDVDNCKKFEDMGCVAIMPLGSSIGSGRGFDNLLDLEKLRSEISQVLIVDAGLGVPSEASTVMEMGFDAVLVNSAIAQAKDPTRMAESFKKGVEAGRLAYLAGRIPVSDKAKASSPTSFLK
tara:strand:- start:2378 stop:3142 length:765 start_codon:yes stop_codon:yes gene_type:complete